MCRSPTTSRFFSVAMDFFPINTVNGPSLFFPDHVRQSFYTWYLYNGLPSRHSPVTHSLRMNPFSAGPRFAALALACATLVIASCGKEEGPSKEQGRQKHPSGRESREGSGGKPPWRPKRSLGRCHITRWKASTGINSHFVWELSASATSTGQPICAAASALAPTRCRCLG